MCVFSLLDNDLYKFSTGWAYMKLYPNIIGKFEFTDRDNTICSPAFVDNLRNEFSKLESLFLSSSEFEKVKRTIPYIPECYWEWLKGFRFEANKIITYLDDEYHLHIEVTDLLYKVTLYEVPILAIVSELRNRTSNGDMVAMVERLNKKIKLANKYNLKFSEFGTRRRYSFHIHDVVCSELFKSCPMCVGTSNVYFALKYNVKPIGTFPHEWVMFHGAVFGYPQANSLSLRDWVRTYDGNLGIYLIDTYTTKIGLQNFSLKHAKLFDGVRIDSGDEKLIGDEVIKHYQKLGIDPTSKTLVFSNALNFDKYLDIANYFSGRIRCSAGIGTNLTNDITPVNIVMKLTKVITDDSIKSCIKISDDLGKHLGNEKEFEIAKYQLNL